MTEAYTSMENVMRWYESEDGRMGSHIPFNFLLIMDLNNDTAPSVFQNEIATWISNVPEGHHANWVVSDSKPLPTFHHSPT